MNAAYTSKGQSYMKSTSNKQNAFSAPSGNYNNDKPQFGGCALVVVLAIVAVVIIAIIPHLHAIH